MDISLQWTVKAFNMSMVQQFSLLQ